MLITFSGLDGAGKSTLIDNLRITLEKQNHVVTVLTMYDHVGLYAFIRFTRDSIKQALGRIAKEPVKITETPHDPDRLTSQVINHGWLMKNILSFVRANTTKKIVYIFDLILFLIIRLYFEKIKRHILIMDRFFYDSLADVADGIRWRYVRSFLSITPSPDLPVFVDVNPEDAFARKGEYSIEYMHKRRAKYLKIFGWVSRTLVLINNDLQETLRTLQTPVTEILSSP